MKRVIRLNRNIIIKYIGYFVLMALFSLADSDYIIVHTPLYISLIFGGENIFALSMIYLLAGIMVNPTLKTLVTLIVPVFIMCISKLLLMHFRKRMTIYLATILEVISILPIIILDIIYNDNLVFGLFHLVLTTIFTYLCIIATFAFLVKKLRYRLAYDEILSFLAIFIVASMGLMEIDIYGYRIYYTILSLLILMSCSIFRLTPALLLTISYGIGGGFNSQNLEITGIICIMTIIVYMFYRYNKYFSVISLIILDMLGGTYFNVYHEYSILHIVAIIIGVIIYLLIPKKVLKYYSNIYDNKDKSTAMQSYINRNRIDINAKINNLGMIFTDIERELTKDEYVLSKCGWENAISERIMCDVCAKCKNKDTCFRALGTDTLCQISPIVNIAMDRKATMDDVGVFMQSRCDNAIDIVDKANELSSKYSNSSIHIYNILENKKILGEQIGTLRTALNHLSSSIFEGVNFDSSLEDRIVEELNLLGIVCHDVLAINDNKGNMEITLVVRSKDKDKRIIRNVLEKLTSLKLDRFEDIKCEVEGFSSLRYVPSPKYTLSYGIATRTKEGSIASGDSRSVLRISHDKVAILLCDGKGSGELANSNSNNTISIIEKLYKAGFDSNFILSFTNNLLSIRNNEDFAAIDMCIVDLNQASVDFIKLGGVTSYIKRASSVDTIEGSSLPLGVLEDARPSIMRRLISSDDVVIIVSDGVTDSIGDNLKDDILNMQSSNAQNIADEIVMNATSSGAIDDTTCIAFKLTKL